MDAVTKLYYYLKSIIWQDYFWFPPGSSWKNLERSEFTFYPHVNDLYTSIFISIFLVILRILWEKYIALPFGRRYKLAETPPRPVIPNEILEKIFIKQKKILPKSTEIKDLSKKLDWDIRKIERWWKRRKVQNKPSEMQRFQETSWRCLFYFIAFYSGLYILYDKPWLWDTRHCWHEYPNQVVTADVYWYYMIELGFYFSLIISLCMDNKRKDFFEMIVHHLATIVLMSMSWTANMIRVGSLVLLVHDAVDYIMEAAKLANYCKYNKLCDALFVIFTIMWFLTRILLFPLRIIRSTLFESITYIQMAPIYYVYNFLLLTLQLLHIFWFYTILRMAYYYVIKGKVEKDDRSDTEPESISEEETETKPNNMDENKDLYKDLNANNHKVVYNK